VNLLSSLKTAWSLIPRDDGKGQDIVKLACRQTFSPADTFELIYRRFHFDGHRWLMLERREPGFWENEGDWVPNPVEFPPAEATAFSALVQQVRAALRAAAPDWSPAALRAQLDQPDLARAVAVVMQKSDSAVRLRATELLREVGGQMAVSALITTLEDPDHLVRAEAAEALGALGAQKAVQPLIDLQEREEYVYVLKRTATALGSIGSVAAVEPLRRLAQRTSDAETREAARRDLVAIGAIAAKAHKK
jgi:hypothetical protein